MKNKYIHRYIGTISVSDYDKVRSLLTPILKPFLVGLRGRGRGCRQNHPKVKGWNGNFYTPNYQGYLPLELSSKVGLYIRIEPTEQFCNLYGIRGYFYDRDNCTIVQNFESLVCPLIKKQIRTVLKQNGITLERTE